METVQTLIDAMLVLIPLGGAARVTYCLTALNVDPDEDKTYRIRARNVVVFCVIAELITGLLRVVTGYFT